MEDLVKKWKQTGLLDENNKLYLSYKRTKNRQEQVAEYLDENAHKLSDDLGNNNLESNEVLKSFSVCCIPLVRRIYDEGEGIKTEYKKLKKLFIETFKRVKEEYDKSSKFDLEAEVCMLVAETYVEKYGRKK